MLRTIAMTMIKTGQKMLKKSEQKCMEAAEALCEYAGVQNDLYPASMLNNNGEHVQKDTPSIF